MSGYVSINIQMLDVNSSGLGSHQEVDGRAEYWKDEECNGACKIDVIMNVQSVEDSSTKL